MNFIVTMEPRIAPINAEQPTNRINNVFFIYLIFVIATELINVKVNVIIQYCVVEIDKQEDLK
jgi:hypothetical protein